MYWTILRDDLPYINPNTGKQSRKVIAKCKCGKIKSVRYSDINSGRSKSCGCYANEIKTKHNHNKNGKQTREYMTWRSMKARCLNSNHKQYKDYGGRGIKICDRWLNSFENFFSDMGFKPINKSIDRIDNNGNYEPSNCRWTTASQQVRNRRKYGN